MRLTLLIILLSAGSLYADLVSLCYSFGKNARPFFCNNRTELAGMAGTTLIIWGIWDLFNPPTGASEPISPSTSTSPTEEEKWRSIDTQNIKSSNPFDAELNSSSSSSNISKKSEAAPLRYKFFIFTYSPKTKIGVGVLCLLESLVFKF